VDGAVDLRRGEIAPRFQLGGIELHNRLPGPERITFLCEDFFHSSAHPRPHVHFIDFDRAGDGAVLALAGRREQKHREKAKKAGTI
jgi:hypothetical protein